MRNESQLSTAVMRRIESHHGGVARKVHGSSYGKAGEPDIDACIRGRAIKIELKMPGNKPTPVQYGRMRKWASVGALVGWVTSLPELDELLSHVDDPDWVNPQLERDRDRATYSNRVSGADDAVPRDGTEGYEW